LILEIRCDRILVTDGSLRAGRILVEDDLIAAVDVDGPRQTPGGEMLLPGTIDLHGDAVEHQMMPRPSVDIPIDIALMETDRQLAANGVTTAFLSLTCSWESGLRSAATLARVLEGLDRLRDRFSVDHRIHLRFESMALDSVDMAIRWIESRQAGLVSINDHFPMLYATRDSAGAIEPLAKRSGVAPEAYRKLLDSLAERDSEKPSAIAAVVAAAVRAGVPVASHDDRTAEDRRANRALGCSVADFPTGEEAMQEARAAIEPVIMGAPNVIRGGSHMAKGVSAAAMVERGLCTILASDYFYPSLAPAAFRLWRDHGMDFGTCWSLISPAPADAVGLTDRGRIIGGARADLLLVEAAKSLPFRILATIAGGHPIIHHRDGRAAFTERSSPGRKAVASIG
jgi:alpha-D-ribose 1-methylphosphonate 5-triphosphate diphosphatase